MIKKSVLGIKHNIYLFHEMEISEATFITEDLQSIFKFLDNLTNEEIYIGGEKEKAIPVSEFETLLASFPTKYELGKYSAMRITRILNDYLGTCPMQRKNLISTCVKKRPV